MRGGVFVDGEPHAELANLLYALGASLGVSLAIGLYESAWHLYAGLGAVVDVPDTGLSFRHDELHAFVATQLCGLLVDFGVGLSFRHDELHAFVAIQLCGLLAWLDDFVAIVLGVLVSADATERLLHLQRGRLAR